MSVHDVAPMMPDVSPTMHDPHTQSAENLTYRAALEAYFTASPGSAVEKMENFAKYVPRQSLARFLARYELFRLIREVHGSIVECGVLLGGGLLSFANLSTILEPYNFQRRIIGFDTFGGFPGIEEPDIVGAGQRSAHLRPGGLASPGAYEDVLAAVEVFDQNRFLAHFPKVQVVRGDFQTTGPEFLTEHPALVLACLYLDFDLYAPTRLALELFLPRVVKGGLVVFDELDDEAFPGETVAVLDMIGLGHRIRRFDFEPRISYLVVE